MGELIDSVPGFERTEAQTVQLEERRKVMDERLVSIENQDDIRVDLSKVPGHKAYEEKQMKIASFILSNKR